MQFASQKGPRRRVDQVLRAKGPKYLNYVLVLRCGHHEYRNLYREAAKVKCGGCHRGDPIPPPLEQACA